MIGFIKMYNSKKGFGFILGEDENDYFFHISEFKSIEIPERGNVVEFCASNNEKGKLSKHIKLLAENIDEYKDLQEQLNDEGGTGKGKKNDFIEFLLQLAYFVFE